MSTLRVGIPGRVSLVPVLIVLVIAANACSGGEVTAPGASSTVAAVAALAPASAVANSSPMEASTQPLGQTTNTFALSGGSFTVTASPTDSFSGDYSGTASVSTSGRSTASLELNVNGGTGVFQGAQGSLSGVGTGAFTGQGSFSLGLDGFIATTADQKFHVKVDVTGTSILTCISSHSIVTLNGTGVAAKVGSVQTVFTHRVGNAGCGP